jgi:hypothetical protein
LNSITIATAIYNLNDKSNDYILAINDAIALLELNRIKYEFLMIDDFSHDDVFNEIYERINSTNKVFSRNEKNLGAFFTYLKAISLAKNDYMIFVDCDDELIGDIFIKCISQIDSNIDLVMFDVINYKKSNLMEIQLEKIEKDVIMNLIQTDFSIFNLAKVFRVDIAKKILDFISKFKGEFRNIPDVPIALILLIYSQNIYWLKLSLVKPNILQGSISRSFYKPPNLPNMESLVVLSNLILGYSSDMKVVNLMDNFIANYMLIDMLSIDWSIHDIYTYAVKSRDILKLMSNRLNIRKRLFPLFILIKHTSKVNVFLIRLYIFIYLRIKKIIIYFHSFVFI